MTYAKRSSSPPPPDETVLTVLDLVSEALHRGVVITVETTRIRVRELPIKQ